MPIPIKKKHRTTADALFMSILRNFVEISSKDHEAINMPDFTGDKYPY
jgi:hypothetical protein